MKRKPGLLVFLFPVIMLVFVLFVIWYIPASEQVRFRISDTELSLETSQGSERKQQHEYDETVREIPEVQAELDRVTPLSAAAQDELAALKAERNRLREEKAGLEEQLKQSEQQEAGIHE